MNHTLKQQFAAIHEANAELQMEINRLTFKPTSGTQRRKRKLERRYAVFKDVLSVLASIQMVDLEKILALPRIEQHVVDLLAANYGDPIHYKMVEVAKLLKVNTKFKTTKP